MLAINCLKVSLTLVFICIDFFICFILMKLSLYEVRQLKIGERISSLLITTLLIYNFVLHFLPLLSKCKL